MNPHRRAPRLHRGREVEFSSVRGDVSQNIPPVTCEAQRHNVVFRFHRLGTGVGMGLWPVLGLLLLAILAPTACLLWFLTEAVRNENMAVRQKLSDVYDVQLRRVLPVIQRLWDEKAHSITTAGKPAAAGEDFAALVRTGVADSYLLFDASGRLIYPTESQASDLPDATMSDAMAAAEELEYARNEPDAAAAAYDDIIATTGDIDLRAKAIQARIRCLAKGGRKPEALRILVTVLDDPKYGGARDRGGRLIVPDVQLFGLELMGVGSAPDYVALRDRLAGRVRHYGPPAMSSSQRLFLMMRLSARDSALSLPMMQAEELAARCSTVLDSPPPPRRLSRVTQTDVWGLSSADRTAVALFTRDRVVREMQTLLDRQLSIAGARVRLESRDSGERSDAFLRVTAGPGLPDWELGLYLVGEDAFVVASQKQVAAYRLTALWVIVTIAVLVLLMGRLLFRQMRLARLKNDFVATVSHELKTPLTSMRVLVDTLLAGNYREQRQVQEYLELIGKENERLSRLIDNFLSFSRMERNKRTFELRQVQPSEIVQAAAEAIRPRYEAGGFSLDVDLQSGLPALVADPDALVTVLVNLLDNACKYARYDKHIALRATFDRQAVCFAVSDHGIGLSRRDAVKVFDRFYQVDQTLSRRTGGCGLGLSIVKFIVDAHGGSVRVDSELGSGSTFTVRIPTVRRTTEEGGRHGG